MMLSTAGLLAVSYGLSERSGWLQEAQVYQGLTKCEQIVTEIHKCGSAAFVFTSLCIAYFCDQARRGHASSWSASWDVSGDLDKCCLSSCLTTGSAEPQELMRDA